MSGSFKVQSTSRQSPLQRYQSLVVGSTRLRDLVALEVALLFASWVPGLAGRWLRGLLYPRLLGACGKGCSFGRNLTLRHPRRIRLGNRVRVEDDVLLDAKGDDEGGGIRIDDDATIGKGAILSCKPGGISVGSQAAIGNRAYLFTSTRVEVEEGAAFGPWSYLVGGGNYRFSRRDIPMVQQYDEVGQGGITIGASATLAAHSVVLDGVRLPGESRVAEGSVLRFAREPAGTWSGVPAKRVSPGS